MFWESQRRISGSRGDEIDCRGIRTAAGEQERLPGNGNIEHWIAGESSMLMRVFVTDEAGAPVPCRITVRPAVMPDGSDQIGRASCRETV